MMLPVTHSPKTTPEVHRTLEVPRRHAATSPYGALDYVPPALLLDGNSLEFAQLPVEYASSQLQWTTAKA
jgi:hypothetical protein